MKKLILVLAIASSILSCSSCSKIKGDGPTVTETRAASGFRNIRTEIDGDLHFTQSASYSLEIRAQRNILDIIRTRTINGELVIDFSDNYNVGNHSRIDIYVSGPYAEGFGIGGPGNIDVRAPLSTSNLYLRVDGSGSVTIENLQARYLNAGISGSGDIRVRQGNGTEEDLTIAGSGSIDLLQFSVKDATTTTVGSGTTKVNATQNLDATITGSGSVYYRGNPRITTNITGSGRVQPY